MNFEDIKRRNYAGRVFDVNQKNCNQLREDIEFMIKLYEGTQLPQRQDSLDAQLKDLVPIANCMGMYDASDFLSKL